MPVPTVQQVLPGALVSIVLKADQRTGREVQGIVGELLTKGDHPRGIKVRLRDGRVGRVQRMVSGEMPSGVAEDQMQLRQENAGRHRMKHRDIRLDEELSEPPAQHDLAMYIKPARRQKKTKATTSDDIIEAHGKNIPAALVKCPVCGNFEGDEAAVAHHVGEHFVEESAV